MKPGVIYLDHNATTPVRAEARAAWERGCSELWANPSSVHTPGRRARHAVEQARAEVAALMGVSTEGVVFTSGGTEADHFAVRGLALSARAQRAWQPGQAPLRIVSSRLEHPAVTGALAELEREGFVIDYVPTAQGSSAIDSEALSAVLTDQTALVTLSVANHEVGTLYPVAELAARAHDAGAWFHCDAVQGAGKIPLQLAAWGVDAASVSAHKLGGVKGVGAAYVRPGLWAHPLFAGGHQERERRGGTENVPGILAFGAACRQAGADLTNISELARLRDRLERRLLEIPGARGHGRAHPRVANTCNVAFAGVPGQLVMVGLDLEGVCVATGAACTSGSLAPSSVLLGMRFTKAEASEAVRYSLGRGNDAAQIDRAADLTAEVVARVRAARASC